MTALEYNQVEELKFFELWKKTYNEDFQTARLEARTNLQKRELFLERCRTMNPLLVPVMEAELSTLQN